MATPTTSQQNLCSNCNNPAIQVCSGCKEAPSIGDKMQTAYYCNAECQKSHWMKHKSLCLHLQARSNLYRVGDILQAMFYAYRERIFDKKIARIEEKDGKLYVHEASYGRMSTMANVLFPLPAELFSNPKDRQAVLVQLTCTDAVSCMSDIAKYMLSGIVSEIIEMGMDIHNPKRQIVAVYVTGEEDKSWYTHYVWEVTLKHGQEQYILDLMTAQHGYYEPVVPYTEYITSRYGIVHLDKCQPIGSMKAQLEADMNLPGYQGKIFQINFETFPHLRATTKWEEEKKSTVRSSIKLPQASFERKAKDLLEYVDSEIYTFVALVGMRRKYMIVGNPLSSFT